MPVNEGGKSFKQEKRSKNTAIVGFSIFFFLLSTTERYFKYLTLFRIFSAETEDHNFNVQVFLLYPLTKELKSHFEYWIYVSGIHF